MLVEITAEYFNLSGVCNVFHKRIICVTILLDFILTDINLTLKALSFIFVSVLNHVRLKCPVK